MKYRAIHISYPEWEDWSPEFDSEEKAEEWLAERLNPAKRDWGYVCYFDDEGNQVEKPSVGNHPATLQATGAL